ncbi:MAG: polymer-forming cytoskeletal protein [Chloroflexota bacterium]|nr:polymer-forming cytoskeletal protein [Chloroflexota bacterium]
MSKHSSYLHWILALALVVVFSFGAVSSAKAFEFIEDGDLPAAEVVDDDLFIVGERVVIDGTVNGDLFAFGQSVVINGTVNGSLFTGAQFVEINGEIAGSVYNGSNTTMLRSSAKIGRNLYFGGFSLDVKNGASIDRDVAVGGYQAVIAGDVGRDLHVGAGALEISGSVGGDVIAEVDASEGDMESMPFMPFMPPGTPSMISPGIYISEDAKIDGTVTYVSPIDQADNIESEPEGGVVFSTPVPDEPAPGEPLRTETSPGVDLAMKIGRWFLKRLRELITLLVLGALVLWQLPGLFNKVVAKAQAEPLPATGWGFLSLLVGYIGAAIVGSLILAFGIFFGVLTLGGLGRTIFGVGFSSLGLAFAVFLLLVNYGSKLVLAFWGGKWILGKLAPNAAESKVWPLVLGVVIYVLLRGIPFVGWIFGLAATLVGLGAIWMVFRDWREAAPVEAEAIA